jgi:hypothetical protein
MATAVQSKNETVLETRYGLPQKLRLLLRESFSSNGESILPVMASLSLMLTSAAAQKPTLIVPDKDADGLSSGVIIHRTLVKLGLDPRHLDVHLVQKGSNIHEENERELMLEKKPTFIIVLDQGSRGGPPVIDDPDAKSLLIDHHLSDEFPKDAQVSGIVVNESCFLTRCRLCQHVTAHQLLQLLSSPMKSARSLIRI